MEIDVSRIFFIFLGFCLGLFFFYKGFLTLREKRKIENTPTSKIRGLSLGEVEIYGEASPGPKIDLGLKYVDVATSSISPFTNKDCVYYVMKIEEFRKQGKNSKWVTIHSELYINQFYIQDDTGKVLVNPKDALFNVPIDFEEVSGYGRDPSKQIQKYLDKNKIKFEGFFDMNNSLKFTERVIAVKDKIYVFGDAMPSGNMSSVGNENIIIAKKGKSSFFFISDGPEKDALAFFGKRVFFEIYGGAALSTLCLALFLASIS